MMRGLVPTLERHHGVRILSEAVEDAVRLSRRYIPSRQLPDKAVSLLDTAAGRVAVASNSTPAAIEDARRQIQMLDTDLSVLHRETRIGADHGERIAQLNERRAVTQSRLEELERQFEREKSIVDQMRALHETLGEAKEAAPRRATRTRCAPTCAVSATS